MIRTRAWPTSCGGGWGRSAWSGWPVMVNGTEPLAADAVIMALPAPHAAAVLREAPDLPAELAGIEYAPCATVNVAVRREQVAHPLDGMGFVVPAVERRRIIGCS